VTGPVPGPRVLLCGGLDPSGGAGLLADLEALAAAGARGWAVATAFTAQGAQGARAMEPATPRMLVAQIDALLDEMTGGLMGGARERPLAVKTGMLGSGANAAALSARLRERPLGRVPLVVDPVLFASRCSTQGPAAPARSPRARRSTRSSPVRRSPPRTGPSWRRSRGARWDPRRRLSVRRGSCLHAQFS